MLIILGYPMTFSPMSHVNMPWRKYACDVFETFVEMQSTGEGGLSSDRVRGSDLDDLQCSICQNILWKPISCQSCETPFCATCIGTLHSVNPDQCPMRCRLFVPQPTSRFIVKNLAKLQIMCAYQSAGCPEVVSYEALEKHERQCDYRPEQCSGCESLMLRTKWLEHEMQCPSIRLTCTDCQIVYQRGDASTQHTELICVNEKLRQAREKNEELKQKHQEELQNFRLDCEERMTQLTGKRTLWRESPSMSSNDCNSVFSNFSATSSEPESICTMDAKCVDRCWRSRSRRCIESTLQSFRTVCRRRSNGVRCRLGQSSDYRMEMAGDTR